MILDTKKKQAGFTIMALISVYLIYLTTLDGLGLINTLTFSLFGYGKAASTTYAKLELLFFSTEAILKTNINPGANPFLAGFIASMNGIIFTFLLSFWFFFYLCCLKLKLNWKQTNIFFKIFSFCIVCCYLYCASEILYGQYILPVNAVMQNTLYLLCSRFVTAICLIINIISVLILLKAYASLEFKKFLTLLTVLFLICYWSLTADFILNAFCLNENCLAIKNFSYLQSHGELKFQHNKPLEDLLPIVYSYYFPNICWCNPIDNNTKLNLSQCAEIKKKIQDACYASQTFSTLPLWGKNISLSIGGSILGPAIGVISGCPPLEELHQSCVDAVMAMNTAVRWQKIALSKPIKTYVSTTPIDTWSNVIKLPKM